VDPSSGLSAEEMAEMLKKAAENQKEDSILARNITIKTESEKRGEVLASQF
jgi:hypothetical protein